MVGSSNEGGGSDKAPSPAYLRALRAAADKRGSDALTEEERLALEEADASKEQSSPRAPSRSEETDWTKIDFASKDPYELLRNASGARNTEGLLMPSESDIARLRTIAREVNDIWRGEGIAMEIEYASAHRGGNEGVFEFNILSDSNRSSLLVDGPILDVKNTLLKMFLEPKNTSESGE